MKYMQWIAEACAGNGARLLDKYDSNWYVHIDAEDLNLSSGCNCILGQLYGETNVSYNEILDMLFSQPRWLNNMLPIVAGQLSLYYDVVQPDEWPDAFFGFNAPPDYDDEMSSQELVDGFHWLTNAWKAEIAKRFADER